MLFVELDILGLCETFLFFFALHGSWIISLSYSYVGDALRNDGYFHFFLF